MSARAGGRPPGLARRVAAAVAARALLLAALTACASPDHARGPGADTGTGAETSADVAARFDERAATGLREDRSGALAEDGGNPLSGASAFGRIHRIHHWAPEYVAGASSTPVAAPLDEWIAPILDDDGTALGTYRVWRPSSDDPAEEAGFNADAALAAAIATMDPAAALIEDPSSGMWFALQDGRAAALEHR
ncbi:hypothetical protein [Leucobacter sp.]